MKRLKYVNQTSRPEELLGKLMVDGMNSGHAKLADWGMQFLPENAPDKVLEVGCGGGRNTSTLLKKYPASHVTAIDYSPVSVAKAVAYHKRSIAAGFSEIRADCRPDKPWLVVTAKK